MKFNALALVAMVGLGSSSANAAVNFVSEFGCYLEVPLIEA